MAVHYTPIGLTPIYSGYFGDEGALGRLSTDLGQVSRASSVALEVVWDNQDLSGAITLYVPEIDTRGEAVADAVDAGVAAPVQAQLEALMAPVGRYREYLGGRYDLRLLSFQIRLAFWDKRTGSHCWIAGEIGDPAGTLLGSCFVCMDFRAEGGHVQACREGEKWPAVVGGDRGDLRRLQSALRSDPL